MTQRAWLLSALAASLALYWLLRTSRGDSAVQKILEVIERHEGRVPYPYRDGGGVLTIGVGHVILPNENHLLKYSKQNPAPDSVIDELLKNDTAIARAAVAKTGVPLSQNQTAALVSLVFNIGVNAFNNSTLLKKLRAGNYSGAADEFLRWNQDNGKVEKGLVSRRASERATFLTA